MCKAMHLSTQRGNTDHKEHHKIFLSMSILQYIECIVILELSLWAILWSNTLHCLLLVSFASKHICVQRMA